MFIASPLVRTKEKRVRVTPEPCSARLEVPADTAHAHDALSGLLPLVDLAELLMEVDGWVGFSDPLLRFSARRGPTPRDAAATRPALFAVLVAEATI